MKPMLKKEVTIGFCVLLALVILFFGINFLKGTKLFGGSNYYYAHFGNVAGLSEAGHVNLNGFKVGEVEEIRYDYENPGNVIVQISVDNDLRLPEGTTVTLTTDILGTSAIDLNLGISHDMLPVGSVLPSNIEPGLLSAVGGELMPQVEGILPKVDSLLTSVNALVNSTHITASLANIEAMTADMTRITDQLSKVTAQLSPLMGKVNTLADNATGITSDVKVITGNLKELPLDSLVASMQATTDNLRALSEQLNDPNSTIGQLMHDQGLYDNINNTVTSLDELFKDIKQNPKRYVTVKIF